jgi:hypothetical protein
MKPGTKNAFVGFGLGLVVLIFGLLEGRFGRYDYTGDSISYLDVAQAIRHGEGALAFSPYWSIGYPFLLAATRWMFPAGPEGEWVSVHVVNLVVFLATYLAFLHFLKAATAYTARIQGAEITGPVSGFVLASGTALFLLWELISDNVSRISPDLLISLVFFLVTATSLRFCLQPRRASAIQLGLLMGAGYLIKAIFLPVSFCVLGVIFLHTLTRPRADRLSAITRLAWAIPALALLAIPYMAAVSMTIGQFTLGESGSLNYAWNVNGLLGYEHWQGGPAAFGTPIHPTHLLLKNPPVFAFAEPFHVTYPPWFNAFYWYDGYHHFFELRYQVAAFKRNFRRLLEIFFDTPHSPVKSAVALMVLTASTCFLKDTRLFWRRLLALWALYLPSLAGVGIYLLVFIEVRYVVGFFIVLLITPFLVLFGPTPLVGRKGAYAITALVLVISIVGLVIDQRKTGTLERIAEHQPFTSTDQWRTGLYLAGAVTHPGEKVAAVSVGNHSNHASRTWARASGVLIVAEMGNDAYDPDEQRQDFSLFVNDASVQQTVFALFRQAGADLVVARDVGDTIAGPGWEPIPGTQSWYHRL